jgi:hypothetical protein
MATSDLILLRLQLLVPHHKLPAAPPHLSRSAGLVSSLNLLPVQFPVLWLRLSLFELSPGLVSLLVAEHVLAAVREFDPDKTVVGYDLIAVAGLRE